MQRCAVNANSQHQHFPRLNLQVSLNLRGDHGHVKAAHPCHHVHTMPQIAFHRARSCTITTPVAPLQPAFFRIARVLHSALTLMRRCARMAHNIHHIYAQTTGWKWWAGVALHSPGRSDHFACTAGSQARLAKEKKAFGTVPGVIDGVMASQTLSALCQGP